LRADCVGNLRAGTGAHGRILAHPRRAIRSAGEPPNGQDARASSISPQGSARRPGDRRAGWALEPARGPSGGRVSPSTAVSAPALPGRERATRTTPACVSRPRRGARSRETRESVRHRPARVPEDGACRCSARTREPNRYMPARCEGCNEGSECAHAARDQTRRLGLAMFATGRRSAHGDRMSGRRLHDRCIFIQKGLRPSCERTNKNGWSRAIASGRCEVVIRVACGALRERRSVSVVRARADAYGYFVGAGLYRCDRAPSSVQRCLQARLRRPFVVSAGIFVNGKKHLRSRDHTGYRRAGGRNRGAGSLQNTLERVLTRGVQRLVSLCAKR